MKSQSLAENPSDPGKHQSGSRRGGGVPSAVRRSLMGAGGVLALVLLASFYLVISQGVQRAHLHWAQATGQAVRSDACVSEVGRPASSACRSTQLEVPQRSGSIGALSMAR